LNYFAHSTCSKFDWNSFFNFKKKSEIASLPEREYFPKTRKFIKREKQKVNLYLKEKSARWENILQKLLLRARIVF